MRKQSAKALKEDLAGYTGREGKLVQLEHGEQWKTLYKKQVETIYISEGLPGHGKTLDVVIFINFVTPMVNQCYINET